MTSKLENMFETRHHCFDWWNASLHWLKVRSNLRVKHFLPQLCLCLLYYVYYLSLFGAGTRTPTISVEQSDPQCLRCDSPHLQQTGSQVNIQNLRIQA